jgi:hypothetical protein
MQVLIVGLLSYIGMFIVISILSSSAALILICGAFAVVPFLLLPILLAPFVVVYTKRVNEQYRLYY